MGPRPVNAKRGRHKSNVPTTDTAFSLFGVSDRRRLGLVGTVQVLAVKRYQLHKVTSARLFHGGKISISGDTFFYANRLFWPFNQGMVVLFQKDVAK